MDRCTVAQERIEDPGIEIGCEGVKCSFYRDISGLRLEDDALDQAEKTVGEAMLEGMDTERRGGTAG